MQIHWHHQAAIEADQQQAVHDRLSALAARRGDLVDVRISAQDSEHHRPGAVRARIASRAYGTEIVAVREGPSLGTALTAALDTFEQELNDLRSRHSSRSTSAAPQPPYFGVIDRVFPDADFGFVLTDEGERVYFHGNAVHGGLEFGRLYEGQRVALQIERGERGLQATAVIAPAAGTPSP